MDIKTDINGVPAEVGDLILFPLFARLQKGIILHFTPQGMYISCERVTYTTNSYNGQPFSTTYVSYRNRDSNCSTHNGKVYKRWLEYFIIEKNVPIPDELKKFIKLKQ